MRLLCQKPSNLATLTWTSSQFKNLPQELFIQSADGSLSFLATTDTFGTYRCEAEEGRHKEVIASYHVRQIAPPRSISPPPQTDEDPVPNFEDESYESIVTMEPVISTIEPLRDQEGYTITDEGDKSTSNLKDGTDAIKEDSGLKNDDLVSPTSRKGSQSGKELLNGTQKDYYNELVVVSLLLVTCICFLILGGLHMWRQRNAVLKKKPLVSPDGSKTNQSMESVPSLSCPEDPEVKVTE